MVSMFFHSDKSSAHTHEAKRGYILILAELISNGEVMDATKNGVSVGSSCLPNQSSTSNTKTGLLTQKWIEKGEKPGECRPTKSDTKPHARNKQQ